MRVAVPHAVVTATSRGPSRPGGVTAVRLVSLTKVTPSAGTPPIVTEVAPVRFAPVMVIVVPPVEGPDAGDTDEIVGGAKWMKPQGKGATPPGVVTETVFGPAEPAGVTAVIVVGFTTVTCVAEAVPILTEVAPVKFVPVIVIGVPPADGPKPGVTLEIVGAAK